MSVSRGGLLWQEQRPEQISIRTSGLRRMRLGSLKIDSHMDAPQQVPDQNPNRGDGPWQSIRLAFGALLLIVGGPGLMLLDGNNHTTTARSTVSRTQ